MINPFARRMLATLGILVYVASYFMPAFESEPGYACAVLSLLLPISSWSGLSPERSAVGPASIFISGLVNPFFFASYISLLGHGRVRSTKVLITLTFALLPFCLIAFNWLKAIPQIGFYLWVIGIILCLFFTDKLYNRPR